MICMRKKKNWLTCWTKQKKSKSCDCEIQRNERHCSTKRLSKIEYLDSMSLSLPLVSVGVLVMMIKDEMVYNGSRDSCIYGENGKVLVELYLQKKWKGFEQRIRVQDMLGFSNHIHLCHHLRVYVCNSRQ